MNKISEIRNGLSRVFDDNLKTNQWKNILDYVIMFFILISTLEVFLSTYTSVVEKYSEWLMIVDYVTIVFFTIEVSLRIWTCGEVDPKYKGWKGKLRYCFSFYGLIDILSTYPFYLHFFISVPYSALKILRIARVFRLFRYMKSFHLLVEACNSKKKEMWISVQFLCIITFILSLLLYFVEHEAQPDVYSDGMTSMIWAFAQYIGDPGGFAEFSPISFWGRIIACVVGVLGIAIFAVPAGLIGSAFIDVMDDHQKEDMITQNIDRLHKSFVTVQDRYTKYHILPKFISTVNIQVKQGLSVPDIIAAVSKSKDMRLRNTATAVPIEQKPIDRMVVELFPLNRPYGCCINRNSKVTIVSTSSCAEVATGNFSYYLAKIGGFNYVSKEIQANPEAPNSYYTVSNKDENFQFFLDDINLVSQDEDSWVVFILSASGEQEPVYPAQFHFIYGGEKGDSGYDDKDITIVDTESFEAMYQNLSSEILKLYDLKTDKQMYHVKLGKNNIGRIVDCKNSFTIRIAWSVTCWDYRYIAIAKTMGESFNSYIGLREHKEENRKLKIKTIGYGSDLMS